MLYVMLLYTFPFERGVDSEVDPTTQITNQMQVRWPREHLSNCVSVI